MLPDGSGGPVSRLDSAALLDVLMGLPESLVVLDGAGQVLWGNPPRSASSGGPSMSRSACGASTWCTRMTSSSRSWAS